MAVRVYSPQHPDLPPFSMPDRFRHEVTYFMTSGGTSGVPKLPEREYWVRLSDTEMYLDDGCVRLVSPLDSQMQAEIELTEEQEEWLQWMARHRIEHIRLS